jgi:hypothetical protein
VDLTKVVMLKLKVRVRTESRSRGWDEFLEYAVGFNGQTKPYVPPTVFKERRPARESGYRRWFLDSQARRERENSFTLEGSS